MTIALLLIGIFLVGMAIGGLVERWRWINSEAVRRYSAETGEEVRLL